jgi:hypothetical protein
LLITNRFNRSPGILSRTAMLTVSTSLPPSIATQPKSQILPAGSTAYSLSKRPVQDGSNTSGALMEQI